jgi:hypothetical protein
MCIRDRFMTVGGATWWQILYIVATIVGFFINLTLSKEPTESGLNANVIIYSLFLVAAIGVAIIGSPLVRELPAYGIR